MILSKRADEMQVFAQDLESDSELLAELLDPEASFTVSYHPKTIEQLGLHPGIVPLLPSSENSLPLPVSDFVQSLAPGERTLREEGGAPAWASALRVGHPSCQPLRLERSDSARLIDGALELYPGKTLVSRRFEPASLKLVDGLGQPVEVEPLNPAGLHLVRRSRLGRAIVFWSDQAEPGLREIGVEFDEANPRLRIYDEVPGAPTSTERWLQTKDGRQIGYRSGRNETETIVRFWTDGSVSDEVASMATCKRVFWTAVDCLACVDDAGLQLTEICEGDPDFLSAREFGHQFSSPLSTVVRVDDDSLILVNEYGDVVRRDGDRRWIKGQRLDSFRRATVVVPSMYAISYVANEDQLLTHVWDRGVCRRVEMPFAVREGVGFVFGWGLAMRLVPSERGALVAGVVSVAD